MARVRMSRLLYITGFRPQTTHADLREHFRDFGEIEYVQKATRHAFVNFEKKEDAADVINELNGEPLFGYNLTIIFAHQRIVNIDNILRVRHLHRGIEPLDVLAILCEAGDLIQIQKLSHYEATAEFFNHEDAMYALDKLNGRRLMGGRLLLMPESNLTYQDPQVTSSWGDGDDDQIMPTPIPHMDYDVEEENMEPDSTTEYYSD